MIDAGEKSSIIRMFHVHHNYGPKKALIDITLDIAKNEFVFISGPSGAGKTTLLKLFYLGEPVSEGQVLIDGINLTRIPRKRIPLLRRKFGVIFQDYKLIPSKTVYDNVALVLEAAGAKKRLTPHGVSPVRHEAGNERRGAGATSPGGKGLAACRKSKQARCRVRTSRRRDGRH